MLATIGSSELPSNVNLIVFEGTKEQWGMLTKDYNWESHKKGIVIDCTDGVVITQ